MKNPDSHIYLYAKGWYKKTDLMSDLRIIFSERNGIDPEYIRQEDIILMLLKMVWLHMSKPIVSESLFIEFILGLSDDQYWKLCNIPPDDYTFYKAVIRKCLSVLAMTKVLGDNGVELIPLDNPDSALLPLNENIEE